MKMEQDCFSARKDRISRLHHSGGLVKLEQACLSARRDRERGLHHCGGLGSLCRPV